MKNILSLKLGTKVKGKEIKEWIIFHTKNQTEYSKESNKMINYLNLSDELDYIIARGTYQASERKFCVIKCV